MTFEWPWLLLSLLLLPLLVVFYRWAIRRRRASAIVFSDIELLREAAGTTPHWQRHVPALLLLLGIAALLFSLARPNAVLRLPRTQSAVMLVMDVSASMTATDLSPNRLDAAKQAAQQFVQRLPENTSVGLVSFSAKANLNAPLTRERKAVLQALDSLHTDSGTAIGDGLLEALDHIAAQSLAEQGRSSLASSGRSPVLIILLSDGESTEGTPPLQAVARAAQARVQINTVGIGQRGKRTAITQDMKVGLDEDTLKAIAQQTGGRYFYASENETLRQIYSNLGSQIGWVEEATEITALFAGLGAVLILVAVALSLRWSGSLVIG